jgi:acyl-CoA thioesterase superfamily protein
MGDLGEDTAVENLGGGRYRATLSQDWEIWGPMGGYVAACALRAAGDASNKPFPASFSCHYLGVARFGPIDIEVEARREGRGATSQRVEVTQSGRAVLDAMVWSTSEVPGLEHDETVAPGVPSPDDLPGFPPETVRPYRFWTTSNRGPFTSNRCGRRTGHALRSGRNGFDSSPPPRSPIHGLMRLGFSSWSICRAGPPLIAPMPGVNLHSSLLPWTSMLRFTSPLQATSGCSATDRHHFQPAAFSVGRPVSGPRTGSSLPRAEASVCTASWTRSKRQISN